MQQIIDHCEAAELPLIAAGDLFNESHPDSYPVWFACQQMNRMQAKNLPVYHTQGQHERIRDVPWLSMHPWPIHVHKKSFTINKYKFYGLDYTRPESLQVELNYIPKDTDIFVAHQVWKDLMGLLTGYECQISDVPYVKMVITGDFHSHKTITGIGKSEQVVTMVSPGSTCLQSVAENPLKYFYILNDDLSLTSIKLKARQFYYWDIRNANELERFLDYESKTIIPQEDVPPNISKPVVRIKFDADIPNIYDKLVNSLADRCHFFPTLLNVEKTLRLNVIEDNSLLKNGLKGCLEYYLRPDSEEYSIAVRLLNSRNPIEELRAMAEEQGL